jgi:hypothetical protein
MKLLPGLMIWLLLAGILTSLSSAGSSAIPQDDIQVRGQVGVTTMEDKGRQHLKSGQHWQYENIPPTSGPHDPLFTRPGYYEQQQPFEKLVHALEHGTIVIYYENPPAAVLTELKGLVALYSDGAGIIVTPMAGLDESLILTAWTKILRLPTFDAQQVQTFIDSFRGHGPENRKD